MLSNRNKKIKTTWDLTPLFKGDDDLNIQKSRKGVLRESYRFINKWRDRNDYFKDPNILKQALDEYEKWQRYYGAGASEWHYFWLRTSQDQNDPALKAKFNKAQEFSVKIFNDIRFFELNLAKIAANKQAEFLKNEVLVKYKHFLERIFTWSRYLLSEPEEKLMELKYAPSHSNWVKLTEGFLSKEEKEVETGLGKEVKSFSQIISLLDSQDKKVRDSAAEAFNGIMSKNADTAEAEINSILANKKVDDELRKMLRPDLSRHLSDDIESGVVDTLVASVSDRFDIAKKYYRLKADLLKVKRLKYHERNVPYGKIDKTYVFDEAAVLVRKVFDRLDAKFLKIFEGFLDHGQIDAFPKKGKKDGAFCSYNLISNPTFVLLNFTGRLRDVTTLAHELGHGINDELMKEKVSALDFHSSLATAEVASTFMEDFVLQELLKEADNELRLAIMMQKLNADVSSIFRQVACYKFEQELHKEFRQEGYLSKGEIGGIFQKHMASYMGDAVEQSAGSENWWVYWSHIRDFFYVYSYASGLLISKSLQNSVKKDPAFIDKVKVFLSAGQSDSQKNIFKKLGINIADRKFWVKGIAEIDNLLSDTIALAKKLKKIK